MVDVQTPAFLKVPMGDNSEVGLMGALDTVVSHFGNSAFPRPLTVCECARAVDWLHAKYGSDPAGASP